MRLLLTLLPLEITHIHIILLIFWIDKLSPQIEDLSKFMKKYKKYIINVLHWLIANNFLYKNIKINYCLLNTLDNKFKLFDIINNIFNYNLNHY